MKTHNIHPNLSMRDAVRIAEELGCTVYVPKSGEIRVTHPTWPKALNLHQSRHDAGLKFVGQLRRLEKAHR